MGKTLYLSDLDGTLLTPEQRLSAFTCETVNGLAERGVCFSYATARSGESATIATEGLTVHLPVIIHNGAFIIDSVTQETLYKTAFSEREIAEIMSAFAGAGLCPIVYAVIEGRHRFSYIKALSSGSQWEFVVERYTHKRRREVFDRADITAGEVFYFACIDEEEKMRPVFELLKDKYRCEFARDIYSGEMWLEVMAKNASKAHAALVLKELLGCDKLVCFGDQTNDLPMFKVADECYAVANAAEELKAVATGIIGSNREDGVAKYLNSLKFVI